MKIFEVENAEGDDIIAVLKKKIRTKYEDIPIYIITNDHDYLQLFDNNTYIYNLQGLNLRTKSRGEEVDLKLKKFHNFPFYQLLSFDSERIIFDAASATIFSVPLLPLVITGHTFF